MDSKKVLQNMQKLMEALEQQSQLTTEEAMEMLDASEATVRRLFTRLAQRGNVLRTFGGISRFAQREAYLYEDLLHRNEAAKQAVAASAAQAVHEGDVLYLDGGTTLFWFAQELCHRVEQGQLRNISVFTNALSTLNAMQDFADITLLGGRFRPNRQDFYGCLVEDALRKLRFSKCFLGTDAVEAERGFTTTELETARLNEWVLKSSQMSFVLADASKFSTTSLVSFAPPQGVSHVVTDPRISAETKQRFCTKGICFYEPRALNGKG